MSPFNSSISQSFAVATTFPKIVTDGLVLNLDAGQQNSYSGSGTSWKDLSGRGNNGTLTNGPTYSSSNGGSLVFDGTDDYVICSSGASFQFGNGNLTVESWIYLNNIPPDNGYVIYDNQVLSGSGGRVDAFVLLVNTSGKLNVFSSNNFRGQSSNTLIANTWYNVILTRTSNLWNYYINSNVDSSSYTQSINLTAGGCVIGRVSDVSGYYMNGRIASTKIYNRALTTSEISQNFNALRGRYGI